MSDSTKLFRNTRALIRAIWIFCMVMVPVIAGVVVVMFVKPEAVTFSGKLKELDFEAAKLSARVGSLLALTGLLTFIPVMRELLRIIDSTMSGDPFVPENARRLRKMGWLLLAFNVLTTEAVHAALRGGILFPPLSISGLVTVLLVFVLAHIFDQGSRMRAELQETV